jgi:hypothetical protein
MVSAFSSGTGEMLLVRAEDTQRDVFVVGRKITGPNISSEF